MGVYSECLVMPGLGDFLKGAKGALSAAQQKGTLGDLAGRFANSQGQNQSPAALMDSLVTKAKDAAKSVGPALAAAVPARAAASDGSPQPVTESQARVTAALAAAGFAPEKALELARTGTFSSEPGLMQTLAAATEGGAKRHKRKTFRKRKHSKKTRTKSSATTPRSYRA